MSLLGLYTNSSSRKDFVAKAIESLTSKPSNVHIAVAFFTEADVVEKIVQRGSRVRLIVRLAYPTQAAALEKLLKIPEIEVRFFTDHAFHPKIYLFGDQGALVGSANLTQSAISLKSTRKFARALKTFLVRSTNLTEICYKNLVEYLLAMLSKIKLRKPRKTFF